MTVAAAPSSLRARRAPRACLLLALREDCLSPPCRPALSLDRLKGDILRANRKSSISEIPIMALRARSSWNRGRPRQSPYGNRRSAQEYFSVSRGDQTIAEKVLQLPGRPLVERCAGRSVVAGRLNSTLSFSSPFFPLSKNHRVQGQALGVEEVVARRSLCRRSRLPRACGACASRRWSRSRTTP